MKKGKRRKKSTKGTTSKPKPRGKWEINPTTQVKESDKIYDRARENMEDHRAIDGVIDFFGDKG